MEKELDLIRFEWYTYDAPGFINGDWSSFFPGNEEDDALYEQAREVERTLAENGYEIVDVLDDVCFGTPDPPFVSRTYLPGDIVTYVAIRH